MGPLISSVLFLVLSPLCALNVHGHRIREVPAIPQETRRNALDALGLDLPTPTSEPERLPADLRARAPSPTQQPVDGYSYLGCYQDGSHHVLTVASQFDTGMTPDLCRNVCALKACPMFGLEWSDQCWCGTALENFAVSAAATECSTTCNGNSLALCGASGRINVYSATAWTGAPAATTQVITTSGSRGLTTITTTSVGSLPTGGAAGGGGGGGGSTGGSNDNGSSAPGSVTLSTGTLAGIAVGAAAGGALLAAALFFLCCRGRRQPEYYGPPSGWHGQPPMVAPQFQQQHPPPQQQQQQQQQWHPSPMTGVTETATSPLHATTGKPDNSYTPSPGPNNDALSTPPPQAPGGHGAPGGSWPNEPPRPSATELGTPYSHGYELPGNGSQYAR